MATVVRRTQQECCCTQTLLLSVYFKRGTLDTVYYSKYAIGLYRPVMHFQYGVTYDYYSIFVIVVAIQLMDNICIVRRLQIKKIPLASLSDSTKVETMLA
jgi:hypothetical protein